MFSLLLLLLLWLLFSFMLYAVVLRLGTEGMIGMHLLTGITNKR